VRDRDRADRRGAVDDQAEVIEVRQADPQALRDVADDQVRAVDRLDHVAGAVVQDDDVVSLADQYLGDVVADEAEASGDQDVHAIASLAIASLASSS
jgi:hypothetical protein